MDHNLPAVSVVVPVYNAGRWLARCLDSIAAQTYPRWECILVDDGSADDSGSICDGYASKDPRFRVIHKENGGVSSARNAGMDAARANVLVFADADDAVAPDLLELAMGLLEQEPEAMVLWGLTMDPEAFAASLSAPRPVTRSTLRAMSWNSALFANVYTQTYSLERIRAHGLRFDTAMGRGALIGEDHDFVTRYCALDRGGRDLPLLVIGAPLYYYAQENENSLMKQAARARSADAVALPPPEPRYCEVLLADMASTFPSMCDLGQEKALQDYLRHYLRCFAFGVWSARQLKEPLPRGFFRRPEIRRLLDLTKEQKVFSVYYLPFRLGLAGLCARLYAWDESHHINYWRFYEATHRLFFRGWKK